MEKSTHIISFRGVHTEKGLISQIFLHNFYQIYQKQVHFNKNNPLGKLKVQGMCILYFIL